MGLFECVNWVDALVRNVILHKLLQEMQPDTVNFNIEDIQHCIDDPGDAMNVNETFIEDLVHELDTTDVTPEELATIQRRIWRLRQIRAAHQP